MSFPSERKGAIAGTVLALFSILALLATGAFVGNATAEPQLGLPQLAASTPQRIPVQFASYDDDDEDLDEELRYVEMERASLETFYGALELVEKMTQIVADDDGSATLAVVGIKDAFETDEAIELLEEVVAKAPSQAARRLARFQLAEIHGEEGNLKAARKQLRALIFIRFSCSRTRIVRWWLAKSNDTASDVGGKPGK